MNCVNYTLLIGEVMACYPDIFVDSESYKPIRRDISFFNDIYKMDFSLLKSNAAIHDLDFRNFNNFHVYEWVDYDQEWEIVKIDIRGVALRPLPILDVLPALRADLSQLYIEDHDQKTFEFLRDGPINDKLSALIHLRAEEIPIRLVSSHLSNTCFL